MDTDKTMTLVTPIGIGNTAIGTAIGYFVGRNYKHPWIGTFGGLHAGTAIGTAVQKDYKTAASQGAGAIGAVALSLYAKKHPVLGFVGGAFAGSLGMALIQKLFWK